MTRCVDGHTEASRTRSGASIDVTARVNHKPLIEGPFRVEENGRTGIKEQRINGRYNKELNETFRWIMSAFASLCPCPRSLALFRLRSGYAGSAD